MKIKINKLNILLIIGIIAYSIYIVNNNQIYRIIEKDKNIKEVNASVDNKIIVDNIKSNLDTIEMLLPNDNSKPRTEESTHIVIHFTSSAYNNQINPYSIEDTYNIFKDNGVSSNYVIDREGQIYTFVRDDRVAYHAGKGDLKNYPSYKDKLNQYSIGIELLGIGTKEEMIPIIGEEKFKAINKNLLGFTEEQYESLNLLLNDILDRNPSIKRDREHIIGHDEYSQRKTDPGSLFDWSKIGF